MSEPNLCTAIGKELIIMTLLLLLVSANVLNYVPGITCLYQQVLTTTCGSRYHYPHFPDEEIKV